MKASAVGFGVFEMRTSGLYPIYRAAGACLLGNVLDGGLSAAT